MRLDLWLVEQGLCSSRARAQQAVKAGHVLVNDRTVTRTAQPVSAGDDVTLAEDANPWVSRAALKLVAALEQFDIPVKGRTCLDIGASTGGFSQVLLSQGCEKIYAVDVGHGQLDPMLCETPQLINLEQTNAKDLTRTCVPDPIDLIVSDVSFIGLEKALPAALSLAVPGAHLIALIKPQFEVGPGKVGKGGIVRDAGLQEEVRQKIENWLAGLPGWSVVGQCDSPILGSDGNREFLIAGKFDG